MCAVGAADRLILVRLEAQGYTYTYILYFGYVALDPKPSLSKALLITILVPQHNGIHTD